MDSTEYLSQRKILVLSSKIVSILERYATPMNFIEQTMIFFGRVLGIGRVRERSDLEKTLISCQNLAYS
jgi:hypothetical protein